ncbi:MAG: hypothetical protein KAG28_06895 [Cocleimonas sp.]|nr:hypothetical protein [Cocleimonas sp.]
MPIRQLSLSIKDLKEIIKASQQAVEQLLVPNRKVLETVFYQALEKIDKEKKANL